MTEDRLSGIEKKLNALASGQRQLRAGQARIESRLEQVETRLDKVEIGQAGMRVEIKQVAEGPGPTQAAIERGFETLRAHIDRRIDPLEQAGRRHATSPA